VCVGARIRGQVSRATWSIHDRLHSQQPIADMIDDQTVSGHPKRLRVPAVGPNSDGLRWSTIRRISSAT
jgi:hypothetical protein